MIGRSRADVPTCIIVYVGVRLFPLLGLVLKPAFFTSDGDTHMHVAWNCCTHAGMFVLCKCVGGFCYIKEDAQAELTLSL